MNQSIEVNQGEIIVKFKEPVKGKVSFSDLGIKDEQVKLDSGFLRLVFDLEGIREHDYFAVPTIEIMYSDDCAETHWQCDFNGTTVSDKIDHYGNSTVILLDRKKLSSLEHHHTNKLIIHAEFPKGISLLPAQSYINFFK